MITYIIIYYILSRIFSIIYSLLTISNSYSSNSGILGLIAIIQILIPIYGDLIFIKLISTLFIDILSGIKSI